MSYLLLLRSNPKSASRHHGSICVALRSLFFSSYASTPNDTLYHRITNVEERSVSVIPVLDKWLEEGRRYTHSDLLNSIKQLHKQNRFTQALEISRWMIEQRKRGYGQAQTPEDIAIRLDLISKVDGLEQAEKYFDSIPVWLRYLEVYATLLKCYAEGGHLEKAEDIFQKMRELGFAETPFYNMMLSLYSLMGKHEQLGMLIEEMEIKGIAYNRSTFHIQLNAYADSSNIEGMEKLLSQMKRNPRIGADWKAYFVMGKSYLKAGLVEKALTSLKESEQEIKGNSKRYAYENILSLYAEIGDKKEVYRLWDTYNELGGFYNSGYLVMIKSLRKLDDIDGVERIWEEWLSKKTVFDIQIPNAVISSYSVKGFWEKAEAFVTKIVENGMELNAASWDLLATGYRVGGELVKAAETIKKAISISKPGWMPSRYALFECVKGLKEQGNVEAAEDLLNVVMEHCPIKPGLYEKLKACIENENLSSTALDQLEGDDQILLDGEMPEIMDAKQEASA